MFRETSLGSRVGGMMPSHAKKSSISVQYAELMHELRVTLDDWEEKRMNTRDAKSKATMLMNEVQELFQSAPQDDPVFTSTDQTLDNGLSTVDRRMLAERYQRLMSTDESPLLGCMTCGIYGRAQPYAQTPIANGHNGYSNGAPLPQRPAQSAAQSMPRGPPPQRSPPQRPPSETAQIPRGPASEDEELYNLCRRAGAETQRQRDGLNLGKLQLLTLYGLWCQAMEGDNPVSSANRPSVMQVTEFAKWKAWNDLKGMSRQEAQQKYITKAREFGIKF